MAGRWKQPITARLHAVTVNACGGGGGCCGLARAGHGRCDRVARKGWWVSKKGGRRKSEEKEGGETNSTDMSVVCTVDALFASISLSGCTQYLQNCLLEMENHNAQHNKSSRIAWGTYASPVVAWLALRPSHGLQVPAAARSKGRGPSQSTWQSR